MAQYLIHYGEIALKGKNRKFFEKTLVQNLYRLLPESGVKREYGRMVLTTKEKNPQTQTGEEIASLFGISSVSPVFGLNIDSPLEDITKHLLQKAEKDIENFTNQFKKKPSFAIRVKRPNKNYPFHKKDLEIKLGKILQTKFDLSVNLDNPDLTFYLEIGFDQIFLYPQKIKGPGGLPAGSSGKVVVLFSGGLDSALATYLFGQRGCRVHLVHIHALPTNDQIRDTKIWKMCQQLSRNFPGLDLTVIPHTLFDLSVINLSSNLKKQETITFRRFLAQCGESIARKNQAQAIVSGDSLGQVASQTMSNLLAVNKAVTMPIFRPLIGIDKRQIETWGKKHRLYQISLEEYKDPCSLRSNYPGTRADLEKIKEIEKKLEENNILSESLKKATTFRF